MVYAALLKELLEATKEARKASEKAGMAALIAAEEAKRAEKALEEAGNKAEAALNGANAALDFSSDDAADAAKRVVDWTDEFTEDEREAMHAVQAWVRHAPKETQRAIYKAGRFVDRTHTAEGAARGMIEAAGAVDDVLGDLADARLPDGMTISVGPFAISRAGVSFMPHFEIDLRFIGIDWTAVAEARKEGSDTGLSPGEVVFTFSTEGDALPELLHAFEMKVAGEAKFPRDIRCVSIACLSEPVLPRMILEATGLHLEGFGTIKLSCKVVKGLGGRMKPSDLVTDSEDYRMFGVDDSLAVAPGLKIGFALSVGFKKRGCGFRVAFVLAAGVVFEIEWLAADAEGRDVLTGLRGTALAAMAKKLRNYMTGTPYIPLEGRLLEMREGQLPR